MKEFFFGILRFAIGIDKTLTKVPSSIEWYEVYKLCIKHSLVGVVFQGIERLPKEQLPDKVLLLQWYAMVERVKKSNILHNQRCRELTNIFHSAGFRSCVLKGQGTALLYPKPEYRQCGDIDLWVEGERDAIIDFVRKLGVNIRSIDVQHSEMDFFKDVPVEIHFNPSYTFNFFIGKKLTKWTNLIANSQFENYNSTMGFVHSDIEFNLVFSLMHIYRHQFSEGIGLRQLIDYFYILKNSSASQRKKAFVNVCSLGMRNFSGATMYVLKVVLNIDESLMLCPINQRYGKFLLDEIMIAGNFGHYDGRINHVCKQKKYRRGLEQFKRNWRFIHYYPYEVLCSPLWKIWHWWWRKKNGYL